MAVAVFDVGKTNIKLAAVDAAGDVLDQVSTANAVTTSHGMRRHDLAATEDWLLARLAEFATRHSLDAFVTSGHGSTGVLVCPEEIERSEPASPMLDYEQNVPDWLRAAYVAEAGDFADRGSGLMLGATHQARQLLWVEREMPAEVAAARWFLGLPQYWAWRLSGVAASEVTYLAAQSDLWNLREGRPSQIAQRHGWDRLLPAMRPAWDCLGGVRPEIARRTGLPEGMRVLTGIHDSSANFYGYQAAGFSGFTVLSTGTWIVGMSDCTPVDRLDPDRGMTSNSDVFGKLVGGVLSMAGREFSAIAGGGIETGTVSADVLRSLIARGTMAMPTFGSDDGLFPGTAGRGRLLGPAPETDDERRSLATLHSALLATECLDALGQGETVILDGAYVGEPLFSGLMAALNPGRVVLLNRQADGVAVGAARLASYGARISSGHRPVEAQALHLSGLQEYARDWRHRARHAIKEEQT